MRLTGRYFDGKTSAMQAAEVDLLEAGQLRLEMRGQESLYSSKDLQISDRIGDTPRRIRFSDGAVFELENNQALDEWLKVNGSRNFGATVAVLERHWRFALLCFLAVAALSWAFIRYGIPGLAGYVAQQLPPSVDERIGSQTLKWLDSSAFSQSKLAVDRQEEIRKQFSLIVNPLADRSRYRLEFRHGGKAVGANALALPGGQIVITDELIELAKDPNEITAVLAHEVGHVVHRHALRMLLQSSAAALVSFALLGDLSSVSSVAASMPAVLLQAKYSRELETEADDFSYDWLRTHGVAAHYFGDILLRLETEHGGNAALSYFSSHPQTTERVRR